MQFKNEAKYRKASIRKNTVLEGLGLFEKFECEQKRPPADNL